MKFSLPGAYCSFEAHPRITLLQENQIKSVELICDFVGELGDRVWALCFLGFQHRPSLLSDGVREVVRGDSHALVEVKAVGVLAVLSQSRVEVKLLAAQPPGLLDNWDSDPFTPRRDGDRVTLSLRPFELVTLRLTRA